jgi:hypothetical protein
MHSASSTSTSTSHWIPLVLMDAVEPRPCLLPAAFIDVDEFLVIMDGSPDLPSLLREYEGCGGLAVNWRMFGSSEKTGALFRVLSTTMHACRLAVCKPGGKELERVWCE